MEIASECGLAGGGRGARHAIRNAQFGAGAVVPRNCLKRGIGLPL
jgi:hypothetical protein